MPKVKDEEREEMWLADDIELASIDPLSQLFSECPFVLARDKICKKKGCSEQDIHLWLKKLLQLSSRYSVGEET